MNDPDRRQTSDGFDHDAMFADIVAHWSETAPEPEPIPRQSGDHGTGGHPGGDQAADPEAADPEAADPEAADPEAADPEAAAADDGAAGQRPGAHHHWPTDPPTVLPTPGAEHAVPAPHAWRAHEVEDDHEEHFEPPPTAPLPAGDLQFWGIIVGMCGGPLLLLYLVFFNREAGGYWMLAAITMSVGGFALLVSRLPRDHQDDDDGARL